MDAMDVTEDTFETDVVERSAALPVVVDFWADWCGPCKMLGPVLEREAAERDGRLELAKVDVDTNPRLADRFGIRGIPAVKAFRNGHVVDEFVGVRSPQGVADFLDKLLVPSEAAELLGHESDEVREAVEAGDHERAFELLLGELEDADPERREQIRRLMVALFGDLGVEHPLSTAYRRRLATALY
jgi:putative thioredoxin